MNDIITKDTDTTIKVTTTTARIISLDELHGQIEAAQAVLKRLDDEYGVRRLEQETLINDCNAKLAQAADLGVVVADTPQ